MHECKRDTVTVKELQCADDEFNPPRHETRSSAVAEGPRDVSCQLKSCQLPLRTAISVYNTSCAHYHSAPSRTQLLRSACVSVCLSSSISQKLHAQTLPKFLCTLHVARSSFGRVATFCTSGFVNDSSRSADWSPDGARADVWILWVLSSLICNVNISVRFSRPKTQSFLQATITTKIAMLKK